MCNNTFVSETKKLFGFAITYFVAYFIKVYYQNSIRELLHHKWILIFSKRFLGRHFFPKLIKLEERFMHLRLIWFYYPDPQRTTNEKYSADKNKFITLTVL